jgi:hypothetical protein
VLVSATLLRPQEPHLRGFRQIRRRKGRRPDLPGRPDTPPLPDKAATAEKVRLKDQTIEPGHVPAGVDPVQGHGLYHGFSLDIVLWDTL